MCRNCAQTLGFLHSGCDFRVHFICLAIHFFECLPLHSQLHLRILFEGLRVALTKQLRDPLVRDAPGIQPCGIRGTKIVDSKVRNLRSSQGKSPTVTLIALLQSSPSTAPNTPFSRNCSALCTREGSHHACLMLSYITLDGYHW
jgi:hypothetical protein